MVAVTGRLEGSDLGTAISQIQSQLVKDVKLPPGMTVEYGGLYQEQQSSFRELAIALVLAVVLVFITLLIEFRSYAHPIAIVTGAVLALSGVLLALFITGSTLNVVSLMGMIMIVGIVAKNGILMLDAVEDHLAAGDTLRDALLRSGRRRFRPVLMTSLAAMLGMLPLALAIGAGSELLQPLAIAVIGGLTMALALSLIVTPTVYAMLSKTTIAGATRCLSSILLFVFSKYPDQRYSHRKDQSMTSRLKFALAAIACLISLSVTNAQERKITENNCRRLLRKQSREKAKARPSEVSPKKSSTVKHSMRHL